MTHYTETLTPPAEAGAARRAGLTKTAAYYLAFVMLGLAGAAIGPTLSALAEQTHSTLSQLSIIFTLGSLGYLLGSQLGGRLFDRRAAHPVLAVMLGVLAVMLVLAPLAPSVWLLGTVLLVMGSAQGLIDMGGNTLLIWVHRRKVGPFMNGLHFCFGIGSTLAPMLIAQLWLRTGGIRWAYWVLALLALPVAAFLLRLPSPTDEEATEEESGGHVDYGLVGLIAVFLFLYVGAEISMGSWIATYVPALELGDKVLAAYITAAFWGAFTAGRLLSIPLAVFLHPRKVVAIDLVGCLLSMGAILVWPHSQTALWIGTLGLGLSMASVFPTMFSLAERYLSVTGKVSALIFIGISMGGMSFPWLIGQLFESTGAQSAMVVIGAALLLGFIIFVLFNFRARRTERQEATLV